MFFLPFLLLLFFLLLTPAAGAAFNNNHEPHHYYNHRATVDGTTFDGTRRNVGGAKNFTLIWETDVLPSQYNSYSIQTICSGAVVIAYYASWPDYTLHALNAVDGRLLWAKNLTQLSLSSKATNHNGKEEDFLMGKRGKKGFFPSSSSSSETANNNHPHHRRSAQQHPTVFSSQLVVDHHAKSTPATSSTSCRLLWSWNQNTVYLFDGVSGKELWSNNHTFQQNLLNWATMISVAPYSVLASWGNYYGALDINTGDLLWRIPQANLGSNPLQFLGAAGVIRASATNAGEKDVYLYWAPSLVSSYPGSLIALSQVLHPGQLMWRTPLNSSLGGYRGLVDPQGQQVVLVSQLSVNISGFDLNHGQQLWTTGTMPWDDPDMSGIAVVGNTRNLALDFYNRYLVVGLEEHGKTVCNHSTSTLNPWIVGTVGNTFIVDASSLSSTTSSESRRRMWTHGKNDYAHHHEKRVLLATAEEEKERPVEQQKEEEEEENMRWSWQAVNGATCQIEAVFVCPGQQFGCPAMADGAALYGQPPIGEQGLQYGKVQKFVLPPA